MSEYSRTYGALGKPSAWELIAEALVLPCVLAVLIVAAAMFGG